MRDLAGQALAFVQDLVTALLNFHTYTEQRIQIFPVDSAIDTITPLNQKVNLTQDTFSLPCRSMETTIRFQTTSVHQPNTTVEDMGKKLSHSFHPQDKTWQTWRFLRS